jgi:translation initiation factor 1 (eIF-1/SUI1)
MVQDDAIEIQGDLRDRIRGLLLKKGFGVKG